MADPKPDANTDQKAGATADPKADAKDKDPNMLDLVATGSFHRDGNFQGPLLQAGDAFSADRIRAADLRANGLVRYADDKAEADAAKDDTPPSTDGDKTVITTRSVRRAK
jgi:hypothetical protein